VLIAFADSAILDHYQVLGLSVTEDAATIKEILTKHSRMISTA
jgi:curved DNA-binding protein CbpA